MKAALMDLLRCPTCAGASVRLALQAPEERDGDIVAGRLACPAGHSFTIADGIADFVGTADPVTERSALYDALWDAHTVKSYAGRLAEFRAKFQAYASLPEPLEQHFRDRLVLDAGCGEGRFTFLASALGAAHVVGLDSSRTALRRAQAGTGNPRNCSFVRADLMRLPLARAFDYVMSLGVLMITEDTQRAFHGIVRCLKPGGLVSIYLYSPGALPRILWPLRRVSLRMDPARVLRLCDACGLGYDPARAGWLPLGPLFRRLGRLDVLGVGRVTFEGLTTPYLREHSLEEMRRWYADAGVEVISTTPAVSISGRRRK